MKEISVKIKIIICNNLNPIWLDLKIYNDFFCKKTQIINNKTWNLTTTKPGIYTLEIKNNKQIINKKIYISTKEKQFIPIFLYNLKKEQKKKTTFILTDKNYSGLPIKRGEINL